MLVGDMDNSGSLNAQVLHLVAERIRTKAVFQVGLGGRGPRGRAGRCRGIFVTPRWWRGRWQDLPWCPSPCRHTRPSS